jgi:hypothetical protein
MIKNKIEKTLYEGLIMSKIDKNGLRPNNQDQGLG